MSLADLQSQLNDKKDETYTQQQERIKREGAAHMKALADRKASDFAKSIEKVSKTLGNGGHGIPPAAH